jgi:hypothetical protein
VNWARENLAAEYRAETQDRSIDFYKNETRDERLDYIEGEESNLKSVAKYGWKSPYAQFVRTNMGESTRVGYFKGYQAEAKLRERRRSHFLKISKPGLSMFEKELIMEKWDQENGNDWDSLDDYRKRHTPHRFDHPSRWSPAMVNDGESLESDSGTNVKTLFTQLDPQVESQRKALAAYRETYVAKHSAPSSTTPTGQPRHEYPGTAHPCPPLVALYTPEEILVNPSSSEAERGTDAVCLAKIYMKLEEYNEKTETHKSAERDLFDFCYVINSKLARFGTENPNHIICVSFGPSLNS